MEEDEILIFLGAGGAAVVHHVLNGSMFLHPMYLRHNPYPGLTRFGLIGAMLFTLYVLVTFADASVTGIYILFYLLLGYALTAWAGVFALGQVGVRYQVDVCERRNPAAAITMVGVHLAIGLIYGSCLWGEADPYSEDEGGWWIPLTFFLLGWSALLLAFALFLRREGNHFLRGIRRDRSLVDARTAAVFLLAAAVPLTDAVAGDFWGWRHGLLTFGVLAGLLLIHEVFRGWAEPGGPQGRDRKVEALAYAGLAALVWVVNRSLDLFLGAG